MRLPRLSGALPEACTRRSTMRGRILSKTDDTSETNTPKARSFKTTARRNRAQSTHSLSFQGLITSEIGSNPTTCKYPFPATIQTDSSEYRQYEDLADRRRKTYANHSARSRTTVEATAVETVSIDTRQSRRNHDFSRKETHHRRRTGHAAPDHGKIAPRMHLEPVSANPRRDMMPAESDR